MLAWLLPKPAHCPRCSWKSSISLDHSSGSSDFLRDCNTILYIFCFLTQIWTCPVKFWPFKLLSSVECWFGTDDHISLFFLMEIQFQLILFSFFVFSHWCPGKILNASPSLFLSVKGRKAHQQVLQSGLKVTGCTVHFVQVSILLPIIMERNLVFSLLFEGRNRKR